MDYHHTLHLAIEIALAAGAILRQGWRQQKQISVKSSAIDLVTEFDHAAEKLIIERLQEQFPDHRFIAEESGASQAGHSPFTWYIDPLDGTNNFAHGFPFFAVSLALYENNRPLLGVIYEPLRDECFQAIAGQGAFLTVGRTTEVIHVSRQSQLLNSLLATGFPYDRHSSSLNNVAQLAAFLQQAQGIRRAGSACLDLAYVAAGRLDGYWEFKLNSWDAAAGILLVQEAGGQVTAVDGRPPRLDYPVSLVASNGHIQSAMLDILHQVEQERRGAP